MIKFCNYNIILPKHFEIVKKEGKPAEKIAVGSEGEAEGGCGGNSASPEPKRSPAVLLSKSRESQKSFLYLLEEKIRRAQIKKRKQNFSVVWRALASGGGAVQSFRSKWVRAKFRIEHIIIKTPVLAFFIIFVLPQGIEP